jgi:hypothetical protein
MTLREELEGQVFMIAQGLVASGKHTNQYELAREALETAIAVKDEVEKYLSHLLAEEYLEGLDLDQEKQGYDTEIEEDNE